MMAHLRTLKEQLPVPGEVLSFPWSSTPGLLLDPDFNSVYIRSCYPPLFETLLSSRCRKVIITGTPGNGASFFLYYLLARLLALPEPPPYILWEHVSDPTEMWCYDHATGKVWSGARRTFKAQLKDRKAWYISDGVKPRYIVQARVLLITSPTRAIYKDMLKSGALELYMPLWTLKELQECRAKVYDASVSEGLAARLYRYYGGVARYVLGVPSQLDTPQDMDALLRPLAFDLDACNTAQVRSGLGALQTEPEASHLVLHINTKGENNFKLSHLDFSSPWVAGAFVERAMERDFDALVSLVASTSGSLRGRLHEQLVHRLLPQGGSFTAVPIDRDTLLRAGPEEKLLLPTSETRSFKDVSVISAAGFPEGVYFRPQETNFATVDSLLRVGNTLHLFQMTVTTDGKAVSAKALTRVFDGLLLRAQDKALGLRLYYVVPPDVFDSFKLGKDSGSWPPGEEEPDAARASLFILKGGAHASETTSSSTMQEAGASRSATRRSGRPAAGAAARRRQPPAAQRPAAAMVMPAAAVGRRPAAAVNSIGRLVRRWGIQQLAAVWR
ncbi:hypothetical protein CHLRE_09g386600v5 [Chlamydomonas reinhardtii]|nr:uncharacterized protein CHLRE_09g386600v5 [Chlamydomonas reinhardtii]PNW78204.1 hypothetical protein CHLRE_09g386600v5 [Chlamydomonas reinhardtii]